MYMVYKLNKKLQETTDMRTASDENGYPKKTHHGKRV